MVLADVSFDLAGQLTFPQIPPPVNLTQSG
jgi:hypothetical protein